MFKYYKTIKMKKIICISAVWLACFVHPLYAQQAPVDTIHNKLFLDEVITSATRTPELKSQSAASVTIINRTEIQNLLQINPDLSQIIGLAVPGMALSSNTSSNRSQSLRGRNMLVLIDGIPQSTPLRATDRDIRSIDPEIIERIEIVKGSTSIYGNGAIGGLMNIITKKNPTGKVFGGQTTVGMSDHQLLKGGGAAGYRLNQQVYGQVKRFNYLLNGTLNQTGSSKDGDHTYLSPRYGLGDTKTINMLAKLKYQIKDNQALEAMYNYYSSIQQTNLIAKTGKYLESPTIGIVGLKNPNAINEGTHANHNFYLKYNIDDIFKQTDLEASIYYQNIYSVFDYRENKPSTPRWQETGGQATIKANKIGARVHLNSEFAASPHWMINYSYGIDYLIDRTSQPLVDGRYWVPKLRANNFAAYLQQKSTFYNYLILKLGIRHDLIQVHVPDYATIPKRATDPETAIAGGTLKYKKPSFNAALSYTQQALFQPYISYSEGFSIFDLGRTLRDAEADVLSKIQTEPVATKNYEAGFNAHFGKVIKFSAAYFYNNSKLGSDLVIKDGFWVVDRSPQKVQGFELVADAFLHKYISLGASYTSLEGKKKSAGSSSYDSYMSGLSIPANKLTSYISLHPISALHINLYAVHTGQRDRFEPELNKKNQLQYQEGEGIVKPTQVYNLSANYSYKQAQFNLGVENLLNKTYYTATSMLNARDAEYVHANGRYVNFTIRYNY